MLARAAAAIDDSPVIPDVLARPFASAARTFGDFNETMRPLASAMVKDAGQSSAWARIFAGGEDPANYVLRMRMLQERFPGNPEITQLAGKFAGEVRLLRGMVGTGVAATVISTAGNGVFPVYGPTGPPSQPYQIGRWDRLEQATTAAVPASVISDLGIFVHADSVIW